MDGVDDLGAVYALEVHAGNTKVRVPELPLDNDERNAFVSYLHRVRMPELVWGEPSPNAGGCGGEMELLRAADGSQRRPAVGPLITHSSAPIGSWRRVFSHGSSWPHLTSLPAFPAADKDRAAHAVEVGLFKRQGFADSKPRAPKQHDQRAQPVAIRRSPTARITATISSTVGGSAG